MFKSLYSGVSGMSANMTHLDVIGNNIANSNTVGFKTGRVTFNEMLTQTIRSASRPWWARSRSRTARCCRRC